ncbi:MAG: histidinol dehydrogenase [Gemmatimonadetes bacterium]|nr:histidinol dehydrogenase [Gemmatimonadota bacterium]
MWKPLAELDAADRRVLLERRPDDDGSVQDDVRRLLSDVRLRGDAALREMAGRFDGVELDALEVPRGRWDEALSDLDPTLRRALERAVANIETFHRAQMPGEVSVEVEPGVRLGRRFVALDAAGVYAPGGRAAYPSSVLMGVVPARVAGVREVVVCSPPLTDGRPDPVLLAAAALAGADRLFALGGAGAIGAMAYGTASVARCDVVVGPGSRWVIEAKRQVAGEVRIDSPAGPSEVLVVADATADPGAVAAEMVAQAEHDPDAAVAAVTWLPDVLDAVGRALEAQVEATPRRDVVAAALAARGALLLAADRDDALAFARAYAAEHLALYTLEPARDLDRVPTAGTVFLGGPSSVAFGDYLTGANHVLPTAGAARAFSGLSTHSFLRSYTWQDLTPEGAGRMARDVERLAEAEGLPAHAAAARRRRP